MSTLTNAPVETAGEARVATVPWEAIAGLGTVLNAPLAAILDGAAAERVLDKTLRANRELSAEQRRVVAESLFGVGLWRRRLRARHSANASPLELLATLIRDLGQRSDASLLDVPQFSLKPLTDWRDRHSIPDWLATELEREFGADAAIAAAALNAPGPVCLRVNRLKLARDGLAERLAAEGVATELGRWSPEALIITSPRPNLYGLSASRDALFEVQDEGSQLLGQWLQAQPGDRVLDLCAGAGGKALQLAAHVASNGRVHAFDIDPSRLNRLRHRAERAGATIDIHTQPPSGRFDRVLVDSPCSELGALRRGPDLRWRIDPASFADHALTGASLIDQGYALLTSGGHLVYATCTFRREENEDVVDAFLARHPQARRVSDDFKVAPHTHGTDGFYAARITSSSSGDPTA